MAEFASALAAGFSAITSIISLGLVVRVNNTDTVKMLRDEKRELLYGPARETAIDTMVRNEYPGEQVKGYFRTALLEVIEAYKASLWSWFGPDFEINENEKGHARELRFYYIRMHEIHKGLSDPKEGSTEVLPKGNWDPPTGDKFLELTKPKP